MIELDANIDQDSQEYLEDRLRYWQDKLRLNNWIVSIRYARYNEFENPGGSEAQSHIHVSRLLCRMLILHPLDHGTTGSRINVERAIVHELIHLLFEPFATDDNMCMVEQSINCLASALVDGEEDEWVDGDVPVEVEDARVSTEVWRIE